MTKLFNEKVNEILTETKFSVEIDPEYKYMWNDELERKIALSNPEKIDQVIVKDLTEYSGDIKIIFANGDTLQYDAYETRKYGPSYEVKIKINDELVDSTKFDEYLENYSTFVGALSHFYADNKNDDDDGDYNENYNEI